MKKTGEDVGSGVEQKFVVDRIIKEERKEKRRRNLRKEKKDRTREKCQMKLLGYR